MLFSLLPTSGIAQSGPQLVADRYSYFSCIVWAVVAGGVMYRLWQLGRRGASPAVVCFDYRLCRARFGGLGSHDLKQTQVWHDLKR
jgi:hypothetical protein